MKHPVNRLPPRSDQMKKVWELSKAEVEGGLLEGFFTSEEMDEKYGVGCWRALPRHAIEQGDKWRLIDDGKA